MPLFLTNSSSLKKDIVHASLTRQRIVFDGSNCSRVKKQMKETYSFDELVRRHWRISINRRTTTILCCIWRIFEGPIKETVETGTMKQSPKKTEKIDHLRERTPVWLRWLSLCLNIDLSLSACRFSSFSSLALLLLFLVLFCFSSHSSRRSSAVNSWQFDKIRKASYRRQRRPMNRLDARSEWTSVDVQCENRLRSRWIYFPETSNRQLDFD